MWGRHFRSFESHFYCNCLSTDRNARGERLLQQTCIDAAGLTNGSVPYSGLIMDAAGNLYGTTAYGGSLGGGTVFEMTPTNGGWNFSAIAELAGGQGSGPAGTLAFDRSGKLYGATYEAGAFGCGNIFQLTQSDGQWTYSDLYDFTCGNDGGRPVGGLTLDASGNLYGTTYLDGAGGHGVVWELTP